MYQFKSTKNFVDVTNGKVTCFFSLDTIPELLRRHLRDIEELIAREGEYKRLYEAQEQWYKS